MGSAFYKNQVQQLFCRCMRTNQNFSYGFSVFIYLFFGFTPFFSFLFAAVFRLLPGFFRVEEFLRKRERGKNYVPWTIKGWKGKFCSEFFH